MEVTEDHKREIERRIIDKVVVELKAQNLTSADVPNIAQFVLGTIDTVTSHDQLLPYMAQLTAQWPCFKSIENIELGEVKRLKEHDIAHQVMLLSKNGKIEEALSLAKTMTQQ